ncbi:MAG: hypothetical protein KIT84_32530 [Labilithrix sp.]|nr:hypothetical protein [Labilithrix sp.]MCW5815801.1 hypothetical protein [Labilithrix sp.]
MREGPEVVVPSSPANVVVSSAPVSCARTRLPASSWRIGAAHGLVLITSLKAPQAAVAAAASFVMTIRSESSLMHASMAWRFAAL